MKESAMIVYKTILTNFGQTKYEGPNQTDALVTAKESGFESAVFRNGELFATYSPITGWKNYAVS